MKRHTLKISFEHRVNITTTQHRAGSRFLLSAPSCAHQHTCRALTGLLPTGQVTSHRLPTCHPHQRVRVHSLLLLASNFHVFFPCETLFEELSRIFFFFRRKTKYISSTIETVQFYFPFLRNAVFQFYNLQWPHSLRVRSQQSKQR